AAALEQLGQRCLRLRRVLLQRSVHVPAARVLVLDPVRRVDVRLALQIDGDRGPAVRREVVPDPLLDLVDAVAACGRALPEIDGGPDCRNREDDCQLETPTYDVPSPQRSRLTISRSPRTRKARAGFVNFRRSGC